LNADDLLDRESQGMEADRVQAGLDGVCFRYYTCPRCGHDQVFLEIIPLSGETRPDLSRRKEILARDIEGFHVPDTTVLVVERGIE
jgi:hypothetical protein